MNSTKRSAETPPSRAGFFAALHAFLRLPGRGAPARRPATTSLFAIRASAVFPRSLSTLCSLAASLGLFLVFSASAGAAAGPPSDVEFVEFEPDNIHATRTDVRMAATVQGTPVVSLRIEYATNPAGPWTVGPSRSCALERDDQYGVCYIGSTGGSPKESLHNLLPSTHYFVRGVAENSLGKDEAQLEFTTLPVAAPEFLHAECHSGLGGLPELNGPTFSLAGRRMCPDAEFTPTSAEIYAALSAEGAETEYRFESSIAEAGPFTPVPGSSGVITVAEGLALKTKVAQLTGLSPETTYFLRAIAANGHGGPAVETVEFQTPTAHPNASVSSMSNITSHSAHIRGGVNPSSAETHWRFEYSTSENGTYSPVPGAAGTVTAAEAGQESQQVFADLTGLSPSTEYYIRLFAENEPEPGLTFTDTSAPSAFETAGPPTAGTLATHFLQGDTLRALGTVNPHTAPAIEEQTIAIGGGPTGGTFTLTFKGQTTAPIPFDAPASGVRSALGSLSTITPGNQVGVLVAGPAGGPYRVEFASAPLAGADQPQIEADAADLTPAGDVSVTTDTDGGSAPAVQYSLQYVSQQQFEQPGPEGGFAQAQSTAEFAVPPGEIQTEDRSGEGKAPLSQLAPSVALLGVDFPELQSGMEYHYRLLASGPEGTVAGNEQTLTAPTPAPAEAQSCPNQSLRTGPSLRLPDCRAYELVTPSHKGGAQDLFSFSGGVMGAGLGDDGDHALLRGITTLDPNASNPSTVSDYQFNREPGSGWSMTSLTPPHSGTGFYFGEIYSSDLTQAAIVKYSQAGDETTSPDQELMLGPPGGPYGLASSTPYNQENFEVEGLHQIGRDRWVGANPAFTKLVLATSDHHLAGLPSGTNHGQDLFEYAEGQLRQLNVTTAGATIGSCGAVLPIGMEGFQGYGARNAHHAVSRLGTKVLFEATPGSDCSAPKHLYMRLDGEETLDIGEYVFDAADPEDSILLLGHEGEELSYRYDTETRTLSPLSLSGSISAQERENAVVSGDGNVIYLRSTRRLTPDAPLPSGDNVPNWYVFDLATEQLGFITQAQNSSQGPLSLYVTADGRFFYFLSPALAGVSTGGPYRYDRLTDTLSSISSSPFRPAGGGRFTNAHNQYGAGFEERENSGTNRAILVSDNGDYAFFESQLPLVPQDVDGEEKPWLL